MHPYNQEYTKEPSTPVGVHQPGHARRRGGSSVPTPNNEAHVLRRESEIYLNSDNIEELFCLSESTSKPRAAKKTSKRKQSRARRREWGPGADPGGRGGPVPSSFYHKRTSSPDVPPLWELERDARGLLDSPIRGRFWGRCPFFSQRIPLKQEGVNENLPVRHWEN